MKVDLYNLAGKITGQQELADEVFNVKIKPEVVHEVYIAQMANQREAWADTKGKGEVRGGGKKPWKQKGTGRARHGSTRSPIWKGGGVVFGPKTERNYKAKINVKTRRLAVRMCLSDKAMGKQLLVAENFTFDQPKTKLCQAFIKSMNLIGKKVLFLANGKDELLVRVSKNLPKVTVLPARDVNVLALLSAQVVIADKTGVLELEKVLK
ncbi:MAG: 50S ribosomal protein L4 [Candidatus Magasanikbacteria bacterium RIFOXYD2_FULL_41_14]|uniref:Large ribosomal subunit protein uL4 n=1 Tax=Candidatus Magasanikbacteria bacterium RIFOXYD2_FULL_41_14 TaxID=1798709 RepID=A0A1F6PBZ1_9BACT|nr:MAG: 50S ribosomal protein L4 [Candidatus Magasanikbacteria bacterium RIFOXYD2_FULL_41_14]